MFLTAITFFVILSVLVLIHELGHFLVACWVGVEVEEFGLGLPPRAFGKKIKGTMYSLNWLPIGGFVKLAGEDDGEERSLKRSHLAWQGETLKKFFWARSKKERAVILSAGVVMNFLLAVSVTTFLLTYGVKEPAGRVHIEKIAPGSPAEVAGLKQSDVVSRITYHVSGREEEKRIVVPSDLIQTTKAHQGEQITLTFIREGREITVTVSPRVSPPPGEGPVGIAISDLELRRYSLWQAPGKALAINFFRAKEMLVSIGSALWRFATLQPIQADVAGPIGIAQVTGQAIKLGWLAVAEFTSILSLSLAVLNILPIPALDGGRLAFVFLEKILGKRVKPAFEKSTHQIGMIILFALILLVSINDILRLVRG